MTDSGSTVNSSKHAMSTRPHTVGRGVALETFGFGAAEVASMGVSLGTVAVMDQLIPQAVMNKVTGAVSKVCVEPYLDTIEKTIAKCNLKECQVDETKSREERAQRLAHGIVVFSTAYLVSLGAKLWTRDRLNNRFGVAGESNKPADPSWGLVRTKLHNINPKNWSADTRMIFAADEAMHIGSLVYLNTKASEVTDRNIETMSGVLRKMGVGEQKAKDISTMAMVWEVPNFLGMVAGATTIVGKHAYGWPNEHKYQQFADIVAGKAMSRATPAH